MSRIEFIRSKHSNFSAHVYGVTDRGGVKSDARHLALVKIIIPDNVVRLR